MDNNISDSNIVDKPDGNTFYEQYVRDISTSNIDFEPFLEENHDTDSLKKHESSANNKECVGVKVKGATISQVHIESTNIKDDDDNNHDTASIEPVVELVREWEAKNNRLLSTTLRKIAIQAATVHIIHKRG